MKIGLHYKDNRKVFEEKEIENFKPTIVIVDDNNKIAEIKK